MVKSTSKIWVWNKYGRRKGSEERREGGTEKEKGGRGMEEAKTGRRTLDFRTIRLGLGSSSLLLWRLIQSQSLELNLSCQAWWQATSPISKIAEECLVVASCCGRENHPPLIWDSGHRSVSHNAVDGPILMIIWTPLIDSNGLLFKKIVRLQGEYGENWSVCVGNSDISLWTHVCSLPRIRKT